MSEPGKRGKKEAAPLAGGDTVPRRRKTAAAKPKFATFVPAAATQGEDFVLPADMRIGAARDLYQRLTATVASRELVLKGESVVRIDTAGLQALLSALLQFSESGGRWCWHNPSNVLVQGIDLLGLRAYLRLQ